MHTVKVFPKQKNKEWECPVDLASAHNLCLLICKFSMQIVLSGDESEIFALEVELNSDDELEELEASKDIFSWLANTAREKERCELTARLAFRAVLEDMIVCIQESVMCAKDGKLVPAFMLLRKPLEESLIILEEIAKSKKDFAEKFEHTRKLLEKAGYGGLLGHVDRIQNVLNIVGLDGVFDAGYIAGLRYDKNSRDTFYGVCNKAMHLFTSKVPIETENMNINLVFSGDRELETQVCYFYSRLPYILVYIVELLEHVVQSISATHVEYLNYQRRRIFSLLLLSAFDVREHYRNEHLDKLTSFASYWLKNDCSVNGRKEPMSKDLKRMAIWGCYPDESDDEAQARIDFFHEFSSDSN